MAKNQLPFLITRGRVTVLLSTSITSTGFPRQCLQVLRIYLRFTITTPLRSAVKEIALSGRRTYSRSNPLTYPKSIFVRPMRAGVPGHHEQSFACGHILHLSRYILLSARREGPQKHYNCGTHFLQRRHRRLVNWTSVLGWPTPLDQIGINCTTFSQLYVSTSLRPAGLWRQAYFNFLHLSKPWESPIAGMWLLWFL